MKSVSVVILAAGFSSRFGKNKLLQMLKGKPLLQHAIENALSSSCYEVIVVVEPSNLEIMEIIPPGASVVENPDRVLGISSSVRAGVSAVGEGSEGIIFLVGDQPFVGKEIINRMIYTFSDGDCPIVACSYRGELRNPMLFGSGYYEQLLHLSGDIGARSIAQLQKGKVCRLEIDDATLLLDVDTPEDLEKAEGRVDENP